MSTLKIEKYVDGACVEAFQLPVGPLKFLAGLLPGQARQDLLRRGLDIDALLADTGHGTTQWLDVEENQLAKRIRFSRVPVGGA
jgi:hypothetical protein